MSKTDQIDILPPSEAAYKTAAEALAEGYLVILPTETIYGVFADRANPEALARLSSLFEKDAKHFPYWHAPSVEIVLDKVQTSHRRHQRLLERLLPGPAAITFESGESIRVPDNAACLAVLQTAHDAGMTDIIAVGMWGDILGSREYIKPMLEEEDMRSRLVQADVRVIIDVGQTALGKPSTVIKLTENGSYEVTRQGPLGDRYIRDRLRRRVLFVCTGNTCRSPMAQVIAQKVLIDAGEPEDLVDVASAGVMAGPGMPMTHEAERALTQLGYKPGSHASRQISRADIKNADEIYGLTNSHVATLKHEFPESAWKIMLLDPAGDDVPDPIGGPQQVYHQTCKTLEELIELRLAGTDQSTRGAGT